MIRFLTFLALLFLAGGSVLQAQGRPILIRDEVNKKKDEPEEKIKIHDPELSKRDVGVGDFYFKKGNFDAAESRYRDAIDYNTQWSEPYLRLVKLYRGRKEFADAIAVCDQFLASNPESKDRKEFETLRTKLEKEKLQHQEKQPWLPRPSGAGLSVQVTASRPDSP